MKITLEISEGIGLIPIGARLYRDDISHLAQVGTDTYMGRSVHPLTIGLPTEARAALAEHEDVQVWLLLSYNRTTKQVELEAAGPCQS